MKEEKIWIGEYNFIQKCFHVDWVERSMTNNRYTIMECEKYGTASIERCWVPFVIGTKEEVDREVEKMRELLKLN